MRRRFPAAPLAIRATVAKPACRLAVLFLAVAQAEAQEQRSVPSTVRPERRIVISLPDRQLALLEDGRVRKLYPIAVGAPRTPSPRGEFRVTSRLVHPTWYASGKVVPPGKANPLGTRWLGLGNRGYGIHGTNDPKSIGKSVSHGCIRMRNADVEELFELLRVGDVVELHGERNEIVAAIFGATPAPAAPRPAAVPVVAAVGKL